MKKAVALIKSTHPIPSFAVTLFTVMFAWSLEVEPQKLFLIGLAMLFQQFSVGLSNDWLDHSRDLKSNRKDKPAVAGLIRVRELQVGSFVAALLAMLFSFLVNQSAGWLIIVMLIIGWAYNLGMKSNWSSVVPYALGFGAIPIFVSLADESLATLPSWIIATTALLGISAHFANALPDLIEDKANDVRALPHFLGQRVSSFVISISALGANFLVVTQSTNLSVMAAVVGVVLTATLVGLASLLALRPEPPRIIFPLLILATFVNVVLLVLGGYFL